MSESKIYHSMVIYELSKDKKLAQKYLIEGCLKRDRGLIDICIKFGGKMNLKDSRGISPLDILKK